MGIYVRRPNAGTGTGNGGYSGGAGDKTNLWDGSDATWGYVSGSSFFNSAGQLIVTFPSLPVGAIPAGRKIIGLRVALRQNNSTTHKGYPIAYLRQNGARVPASVLYQPDGYSTSWRTKSGPYITKNGAGVYTTAEIEQFSADYAYYSTDSAMVADIWQDILYDEPLTNPTVPYPASAQVIDTSSVSFSVQLPAPQAGQLVRGVFQVAKDSGFTTSVKTFYGAYHERTGATERANYTSNYADATFTDLGPGVWYYRQMGQDIVGNTTAWSATTTFTITHAALPLPINTSPAPGSINVDPYGIRSARVDTVASDNRAVGIEWQYSKSSSFASGVVTWKNLTDTIRVAGTVSYDALPKTGVAPGLYGYNLSPDDPSQYLSQGVWYVRTRTVDRYGQTSAWSSSDTITVQHPPLAQNISPTSSKVIDQNVTPVRWTFGDPWTGDAQTAYQVRVYNAANTLVYDSGKLSSTALQAFLAISATYLYNDLRYTINLWDKDDVTSTLVASNNFLFSNSPAIVQSYPAQSEIVLTGQPKFVWNPGIGRPGTTQRSFELKIYRQDTNALVYTSGEVVSTATSHTPPQVILRNAVDYRETLRIVDSDGLSSTLNRNFRAEYQAPPEPMVTVDPLTYFQQGYANIDWSGTVPDAYFTAWKVYRREQGATDWELIYTENDSSVTHYHDWLVPSVGYYEYSVTQLADRSGYILESGIDEDAEANYIVSEDYWLIIEDDETRNVRLYSVSDDGFTDDIEINEYVVKGRGKRVNYGTVIGMNGTLSVKLRHNSNMTAREQRQVIKGIQLERGSCLLRDPFGNITRIAIGALSTKRLSGVGTQEFADVEIPYMEVFE